MSKLLLFLDIASMLVRHKCLVAPSNTKHGLRTQKRARAHYYAVDKSNFKDEALVSTDVDIITIEGAEVEVLITMFCSSTTPA